MSFNLKIFIDHLIRSHLIESMSFPPNQGPPPVERQSYESAAAEAAATPIAFNPTERAALIRSKMNEMLRHMSDKLPEAEMKERLGTFPEDYPQFYQKILNKEDLTPIRTMLVMLDRMGEGRVNQHEASMVVGTDLYKKFVEPQIRTGSAARRRET